ncbi:MAG: hypothetical protein ACYS21_04890, partial [Planctomycetota bacterium]
LKGRALGLVEGSCNVNAYTFGEDFFNGDEDPIDGGPVSDEEWYDRGDGSYEFNEPTVERGGLPMKFYFSVDPWAIGLDGTAVQNEATISMAFQPPAGPPDNVDEDVNNPAGSRGPWRSNGEAAGDIFSSDPILLPGINVQEYDETILALWGPRKAGSEDPNMEGPEQCRRAR